MAPAFKTVGLIGKYKSPAIAQPLLKIGALLAGRGVRVLVDPLTASYAEDGGHAVLPLEEIGRSADLVVVLGGDGTLLNVACALATHDIALVGVNQGRLGFLTDISIDTMVETVGAILDGEYVTEQRMMLEAEVLRDGRSVFKALALNDVVVSKGGEDSMIEFEVRIDGRFLYALRGDGLIVASPTGSTAYALSSGGPIIHPALSAMALVPICPHTFSSRPIVIGGDGAVEIVINHALEAHAHLDNHAHYELCEQDRVVIRRHAHSVRLLHPAGHDYYNMLRAKLHWTELY
ncbi:MAG TPA: NAD kinase [Burkholderiales bacterium]|nr:NAD kinase [Burkholderiales bacterium]